MMHARTHLACALIASITLVSATVEAQPERQRIRDLNRQAMTAYGGLELETAKSLLEQALQMAQRAGLTSGPELALTYMNLGVVTIAGFGDNGRGIEHFVAALTADPTVTLDPNTSTPDVQALFAQARARAARSATTANVPQTDTTSLAHIPVEEQLARYPVPIFVQAPAQLRVTEVLLRYRSGGTGAFSTLVMDRMTATGFGMEIPCAAIHSASVQYFVVARDAQQQVVGRIASEQQPINVRIVSARTRPEPVLPNRAPPRACDGAARASTTPAPVATAPVQTTPAQTSAAPTATAPTPTQAAAAVDPATEAEPALRSTGTGVVGDACAETAACSGDLVCEDGRCVAPEPEAPQALPRFFVNIGYAGGWIAVRQGMQADSTVPYDPRLKPPDWNDAINGPYAPPGYSEAEWRSVVALIYPAYTLPEDGPAPPAGDPRAIDPQCDVDPDQYCVRVTQDGVRPIGGLHIELGYWMTERLGLSVDLRTATHAGRDPLARTLFGLRAHVRISRPRVVGPQIALFLGGGVGQLQGRVPQGRYEGPDLARASTGLVYLESGTKLKSPWVTSGLGHVQLGASLGYRFTERIGITVQPVLYLLFPRFAIASDTTLSVVLSF